MDDDYFTNNAKLRQELASTWQIIEQAKEENARLRKALGEPVGEIVAAAGSLNDAAVIRWTGDYRPTIGDLLYAPSNA